MSINSSAPQPSTSRYIQLGVTSLLPFLVLVAVLVFLRSTNPLSIFQEEVPPIEQLELQRLKLDDEGFLIEVINSGADPVTIAQVLVDEAYWSYEVEKGKNPLKRLETASLRIPYPWVEGEAHEITLITRTGVSFTFDVEVAVKTPEPSAHQFRSYGLLGFYIGVVPVGLGLLWYPFLRTINRRWLNAVLALTVGLLVFLALDTLIEALEIAGEVPTSFQGETLVFLVTLISLLAIVGIGKNFRKTSSKLYLAYMIALGIGFHNLGEGLAVGGAFAIGQVSLGTVLVVGFTLHNITEGIGIAAPIANKRPHLYHFVLLTILAGGPAILGTWIGGFSFNPLYTIIFLSIGAGAILQVIYEVSRLIIEDSQLQQKSPLVWPNIGGGVAGILIMYLTAFLVA